MSNTPIGSYEEAREFALKRFERLTPAQKLQWLAEMTGFINAANPHVRLRRLGLKTPRQAHKR